MTTAQELSTSIVQNVARDYHKKVPGFAKDTLKWAVEKQHLTNLLTGNKSLRDCIPGSVKEAILNAGAMGLSFNPARAECYLIPRRMWRGNPQSKIAERRVDGPLVCYASPSYVGLIQLAVKTGFALIIRAQVVFQGDAFRYFGPLKEPKYEMCLGGEAKTWETAIGVYADCKLKDGSHAAEWMDKATIERIRSMSDNPKSIMWNPDKLWTEGWRKAVIRRMFKTIPVDMGPELSLAANLMNQAEGITIEGEAVHVEDSKEPTVETISKGQAVQLLESAEIAGLELSTLLTAFHVERIEEIPANMLNTVTKRIEVYADRKANQTN